MRELDNLRGCELFKDCIVYSEVLSLCTVRVAATPASYSVRSGFEFRPRDRLF
jgi:hypothetical protein